MPPVLIVIEYKDVVPYLNARGLLTQYQKAKQILLSGDQSRVQFKQRHPHSKGVWSFRINRQFRAFGFFRHDGEFAVSDIDNHQ